MDRYAFTDEEPILRILPEQMWVKKSHPNEILLILHYLGNKTYECLSIHHAEIGIPTTISSTEISNHYNFSHTVDNK